ncbi:MAG: FtsX-like permease family protein [Nitrososphaerota archaeon]|nr:hypothetical protein [Candidatus Bathyarchaeota archaeon]MDW8048576.1 FtsX-like permease family protein [Nitrososphaerota archaeon]
MHGSRKLYGWKEAATYILAVILLVNAQIISSACEQTPRSIGRIYIKVTDANTGEPISNATLIILDITTGLEESKIRSTGQSGEYVYEEAVPEGKYWIYAYKGNLTSGYMEYAPAGPFLIHFSIFDTVKNLTVRLVPCGTIRLKGPIWMAGISELLENFAVTIIDPACGKPPMLNGDYISQYNSTTRFYLAEKDLLNKSLVFVPADVNLDLLVEATFYRREVGFRSFSFRIENVSVRKSEEAAYELSYYSLRESIKDVNSVVQSVMEELSFLQSIGFYFVQERSNLVEQISTINDARRELDRRDYYECWKALSKAYSESLSVRETLRYYVGVSTQSAVYLPTFLAVYSVILAFFLFEDDRKKVAASLIFYIVFLVALFQIYPGTRTIINPETGNIRLFLSASILSIVCVMVLVFFLQRRPRLGIEGLTTFRDVLATFFSMGKRQIRVRRSRGILTLSSVILLILAFTSLTSMGYIYGLTYEKIPYTSNVEGILIRSTGNETFIYGQNVYRLFIPFGSSLVYALSQDPAVEHVAPKIESYPSTEPIGRLFSNRSSLSIYGLIGIVPSDEAQFTRLNNAIVNGEYLKDGDLEGLLISSEAASELGVNSGDKVIFSIGGIVSNFTVRGIFGSTSYQQLRDIDGQPFGPKKAAFSNGTISYSLCEPKEVIILNFEAALELQAKINVQNKRAPEEPGPLNQLSRISIKPKPAADIKGMVETIVKSFGKDAYVSKDGAVYHYYIGFAYEAKGALEILVPLVMALINVGAVMLNAVYERSKEMKILTTMGSNPMQLASLFIAEAMTLGMVGGGLGYIFGLGFYRIMLLTGTGIEVREKVEWYWSAICLCLAVLACVLSTLRPALLAIKMYTPSMVRKAKISEEEKETRMEEIFKVYQERSMSMPVKVKEAEILIFTTFIKSRMEEMRSGIYERIEDVVDEPEVQTPTGRVVRKVKFRYNCPQENLKINNELVCSKDKGEDKYRVHLVLNTDRIEISEKWIYRITDLIRDILMEWVQNKDKILGR